MASINITVDTNPMADKLHGVQNGVNHTTAAVGVMQTAVIAAELDSAKQICGKLDVGFLNVIMSQIAQRIANETANMQATVIEMTQQQRVLQNLQTRMDGDYHMIASRYAKLFSSLNQELRNRITELDKPVMQLCQQQIKQLQTRILNLVSGVPVLQAESLQATQTIAAAHLKRHAQKLIEAVGNFVKGNQAQRAVTKKVAYDTTEEKSFYAPVILEEEQTEIGNSGVLLKPNPTLSEHISLHAYSQIVQSLLENEDFLDWKDDSEHRNIVVRRYREMVESAQVPQRVKQTMMQLFNEQFMTL